MRVRTVLAFGIGYLLGTKAGRERYRQILAAAKRTSLRLDEAGRQLEQRADPGYREGRVPRAPFVSGLLLSAMLSRSVAALADVAAVPHPVRMRGRRSSRGARTRCTPR